VLLFLEDEGAARLFVLLFLEDEGAGAGAGAGERPLVFSLFEDAVFLVLSLFVGEGSLEFSLIVRGGLDPQDLLKSEGSTAGFDLVGGGGGECEGRACDLIGEDEYECEMFGVLGDDTRYGLYCLTLFLPGEE